MALIEDGKTTIMVGIAINIAFMILKFYIFLSSKVNLFFADTIDSVVDSIIMFMIIIFLRFNINAKTLTFLNMDMMFLSQWSMVIIFRVMIIFEQIGDLLSPTERNHPELIIISSSIILFGGMILALLFVDEDDVIKCFIHPQDKQFRTLYRQQQGQIKKTANNQILPMFAEALDNFVTTFIALIIGILLYFQIWIDYLYLIDDISNMIISFMMLYFGCTGIWEIAMKYEGKSSFVVIFPISTAAEVVEGGNGFMTRTRIDNENDGNGIGKKQILPVDHEEHYQSNLHH